MAEKKATGTTTKEEQARAEEAAKTHEEAERAELDETEPGGVYVVDGEKVNAQGEKLKK